MTGIVGVIANDAARFTQFWQCMNLLDLPEGSRKEVLIGGDWCGARNSLAQITLDEGHDWLWFMDDDHTFAPSMLVSLLAHDRPLVTPICLTRQAPFRPVQYTEKNPDAEKVYKQIPLDILERDTGLVRLEAGGCAGMLIRREVLEAIPPPWFEYTDRSEDIIFCEKALAAGYELWGDLSCRLGHISIAVIEPAFHKEAGKWCLGITVGGGSTGLRIVLPFPKLEETP